MTIRKVYEVEGVIISKIYENGQRRPGLGSMNYEVWLEDKGTSIVDAAVLLGPGSQFNGRRVRITITDLESIEPCNRCGRPSHEATTCPVK